MTNADEVILATEVSFRRREVEPPAIRAALSGDDIRDWMAAASEFAIFPYEGEELAPIHKFRFAHRWLWSARTTMGRRATFDGGTYFSAGLPWWKWHQVALQRLVTPLTIVSGEVATHNHFVLDRGGKVFKQTAPVIKLPEGATEDDHFALLGLLNSSTACFWLKQACFPKGGDHQGNEGARVRTTLWDERYAFNSTQVGGLPIPAEKPLALARELDRLAQELKAHAPAAVLAHFHGTGQPGGLAEGSRGLSEATPPVRCPKERPHPGGVPESAVARTSCTPPECMPDSELGPGVSAGLRPPATVSHPSGMPDLSAALAAAHQQWTGLLQRMIALQEELDWECYRIYGLLPDASLSFPLCASAPLRLGVESGARELTQRRKDAKTQGSGETDLPPLKLGERAFEIVLARKLARGEAQTAWFERHGSTPITELPAHWPAAYRALVERRLALIARDRNIALIEQPEYKRRWNTEPWDEQQERALRQWLLNRLEGYAFQAERMMDAVGRVPSRGADAHDAGSGDPAYKASTGDDLAAIRASWPAGQKPTLVSTNQLAELVQADAAFLKVAEVYAGAAGFSVPKLVRELVESESVPFLPFQRYKESGLRKRQDWERTWDLQRKEDAIDARVRTTKPTINPSGAALPSCLCVSAPLRLGVESGTSELTQRREDAKTRGFAQGEKDWLTTAEGKELKKREVGDISVPPKYAGADFKSSTFWRLRGKLDVPKERWISYSGAEREGDPSPVIAWAGWNHLQQAQALAEYYLTAKDTWGWSPERLTVLLAGLADLLPWLKQWHNELNPEYGMGLGDYFAGFLDEECRKNGTTVEGVEGNRFGGD